MTDLDQIRARFQPLTRSGHKYEIFAKRNEWLYGRVQERPERWNWNGTTEKNSCYDLIPRSPHEELLAEVNTVLYGSAGINLKDCIILIGKLLRHALQQKESTNATT